MSRSPATTQFRNNLVANFAYLFINAGIAIWLVPYLIANLGVAVYGLIPLAVSLTAYVGLISHSLNSAVSRFLTIDLQRDNADAANRTFNTALAAGIFLVALAVPLAILIATIVPRFLDIPEGFHTSTQFFFLGVLLAFLVSVFRSTFSVSAFSHNRIDLVVALQAIELVVRTGLIVAVVELVASRLWPLGTCYLSGSVVALLVSIVVWKKLTPQLHIDLRQVDRSRLRELLGMSGWVVLNQVGALLFLNIDLLVVNKVLGGDEGGRYAAVLQWPLLVRSFAGLLISTLTPTILALHARGQRDDVFQFCRKSVKLVGIAVAIPVGLMCGFAPFILRIWIGEDFVALAPLLLLMVAYLTISIAARPLFAVQQALNKVRTPGVVTLLAGILNLILALVLTIVFDWGLFGVAAAGAVTLTLRNAIFTPLHAAKIFEQPWHSFFGAFLPGAFCAAGLALSARSLTAVVEIAGWTELIVSSALLVLLFLAVTYRFVLDAQERKLARSLFSR